MSNINFNPFPQLTTSHLILRQLFLKDANEVFLLRSDKQVNKYLDRPIANSVDDARKFINNINNGINRNEFIYWAIAFKTHSKLIGSICLWNISENGTKSELGLELLPDYQGKGIIQGALPEVIRYGFEEMELHSIEGEVDPKNVKSIKLMEKNGFISKNKLMNTLIYSLQNPSKSNHQNR